MVNTWNVSSTAEMPSGFRPNDVESVTTPFGTCDHHQPSHRPIHRLINLLSLGEPEMLAQATWPIVTQNGGGCLDFSCPRIPLSRPNWPTSTPIRLLFLWSHNRLKWNNDRPFWTVQFSRLNYLFLSRGRSFHSAANCSLVLTTVKFGFS